MVLEANDTDGEFNQARVRVRRRRDAVEAGLDLPSEREELLRAVLEAKFAHDVDVVARPQVICNGFFGGVDGLSTGAGVFSWLACG